MIDFTGRMTSLTDIDGSVFAYEFDGEGNRLSQSLNDCLSKRFVYDGADVLLELNPTNGVAYAWVNGPGIDQPVERLLFIDGAPRAWRARATQTRVETAASPRSSVTATDTYVAGRLQTSLSSSGVLVTNAYDALGRRTLTRIGDDAHASGVLLAYDASGRPAWQEDLAGNRTAYGYDPETGLRTTVTDALTNVVHTLYDLQGRVTNTWGATYPVGYEYDAYGRMAAMHTWRDENVAPDITRWNYDPATGLLTNKVYADGLGPRYEYDPAGRLAKRVWARGIETDYGYDALGQLTSIDYFDATPDVAYTYDRLGRQLTVTDVLGTRTNVYSPTDLLEERHPDGTALVRSYDAFGRPSGLSLGPDYAVGYGYDEYGRFSTVAVSNGATFTYSYVPNSSLLSGYTNDLGLSVAYEYEPLRDVKTLVSNAWSTNTISTFAYTYDAIGRRTRRIDDSSTTNLFGYNLRSELVSAEMGTNTYSYAYDPIGNRTATIENGLTTTYAANELNQYTALNPASTNPTPFAYDPDGNMTSDDRFVYAWNGENRMVMASNDEVVVTYAYDHQGRMVRKEICREGVKERNISYIWDNWNIIRETLTTNNTPLITHNVWGLDLDGTLQGSGGVGGLLTVVRNDGNFFPAYDANGNVCEYVSGSNGTIAAHYEYSSFGGSIVLSGLLVSTFTHQFSTKPWCPVTALTEYQYRKYQPDIGRWMSRDPIGQLGSLSEYLFAGNKASIGYDVLGLKPKAKKCEGKKHMRREHTIS